MPMVRWNRAKLAALQNLYLYPFTCSMRTNEVMVTFSVLLRLAKLCVVQDLKLVQ